MKAFHLLLHSTSNYFQPEKFHSSAARAKLDTRYSTGVSSPPNKILKDLKDYKRGDRARSKSTFF